MPADPIPQAKTKSHCNKCGPERDHEVLYHNATQWSSADDEDDEYDTGVYGGTEYDLLRCCGCSTVSLRETKWNSECTDHRGKPEESISYYPPAIFRTLPRWVALLQGAVPGESIIEDLLKEIYIALQNDLHRLALMGIRALLEHVMMDKVGDKGSFKNNIKAFGDAGFIAPKQREFLETVIEAGHATMHRSYTPTPNDLISLMDITESIIESAYVHERRVQELKGSIPPRKP